MEDTLEKPLGRLERFPLEVRREIYSYLLADFKQVHNVSPRTGVVSRSARWQSSLPLVLSVSKTMRGEVADSMLCGRIAEIKIDEHAIITNFSTLDLKDLSHSLATRYWDIESRMILPLNRPLVFTISMPDIRRVEGSYQIRRNVAKVVQILNRQAQETDKKRSKIIVKFAARYEFLLFNFSLNDFSMVVAPFLRLKSDRYDSFKIEHLPRVMLHHAKLDTYCNYLEEAMRDGLDNTGPLFYQQAILDLKVPLCIYEDHFVNKTPTVLARPLEMRLGEEIQKGLQKVRAWHIAVGRVEPKWVDTLIRMDEESLVLNEAERATLWRDIFQGVGASHVGYWAAGLSTTWNPFFLGEEGEKIAPILGIMGRWQ